MTHLLNAIGADGINGDTMNNVPEAFADWQGRARFAIEPEDQGEYPSLQWTVMGWGYYTYPFIPTVDAWKWLEHRHLTNICERWSKNHNDAIQFAFFNGAGFESWENVWGNFNRIKPRDGEALRRVSKILRFLGARGLTISSGWVPHTPTLAPSYLFASLFPAADNASFAWTVVNRNRTLAHDGPAIDASQSLPSLGQLNVFDLYHGRLICAAQQCAGGVLPLAVEAAGFGAVLATPHTAETDKELAKLLATMRDLSATPLSNFSSAWRYEVGARVPVGVHDKPNSTDGMVSISGGPYRFAVTGIEIEDGGTAYWPGEEQDTLTTAGNAWTQPAWPHAACSAHGEACAGVKFEPTQVDLQYEWEPRPQRFHAQWITLKPYLIDKFPVTQAAFSAYLQRRGAQALPKDRHRYL